MNSHPIVDSVILVTGAGKGIGRAFVEEVFRLDPARRKDLKLFLTSRTASDLEELRKEAETLSISVEVLAVDLADDAVLPVTRCLECFGRIDILVHSAGVGRFGDLHELTWEDLEFTSRTNIHATFLLLQKTYLQMKSQTPRDGLRGQIQVVTSIAAEMPFEQSAIYCMTKYAQRGLLDVLKLHGRKDRIRILEVKPGATFTPMWGEVEQAQRARMMEAADIAGPMVDALFASSRSSVESITIRPVQGDL